MPQYMSVYMYTYVCMHHIYGAAYPLPPVIVNEVAELLPLSF